MNKNRVKITRVEMQKWASNEMMMRDLKSRGVPMQGLSWHSGYSYRTSTNPKNGAQTIYWSKAE